MMKKIKNNIGTFIITLVFLLIPMLIGVILWNKLPNEIATHWGADGNPNGYSSKAGAVLGMPAIIMIVHLIVSLVTAKNDTNAIPDKVFRLLLWICPVMSIVISILIYATALEYKVNVSFMVLMLVGIIWIVIGNYVPKARPNPFFGVRIKWTLESKKNWEHTNRFSAKIMIVIGVVCMTCAVLSLFGDMGSVVLVVFIGSIIVSTVAMILYSYLYYLKHNQDEDY